LPQTPQTQRNRQFQENSPGLNFSFSPTPTSTPLSPFSPGFQQLPVEAQLEIQRQLQALQQQLNQGTIQPNNVQNQPQPNLVQTTIFQITMGPQIWDFFTQMLKLAVLSLIFTTGQGLKKWFYLFMVFMTINMFVFFFSLTKCLSIILLRE
jgi:hypothetical protein